MNDCLFALVDSQAPTLPQFVKIQGSGAPNDKSEGQNYRPSTPILDPPEMELLQNLIALLDSLGSLDGSTL